MQFMALAEGSASTLVTTVTSMAGTMLETIAGNAILSIPIGISVAGMVVGLVWRMFRKH